MFMSLSVGFIEWKVASKYMYARQCETISAGHFEQGGVPSMASLSEDDLSFPQRGNRFSMVAVVGGLALV